MSSRLDRVVLLSSVVLLSLVAASVVLIWRLGVFDDDTTATNAQVVAAALGLVGVLLTASLTFIGVLLKHSIDARTLQQTQETEGRLRLETSIRAVELLTENGVPATQTRQAGALFVLVNLNELEFAFALLGQIWAEREVSPGAAVWVIGRLLASEDSTMQIAAAQLLDENADDLATSAGYEFPVDPASAWEEDLSPLAREFLLSAFARMMIAKRFNEWHHESLNGFVSFLDSVRRRDDKTYIRDGALVCLDALLEVWDIEDYGIRLDDEYWDIDELRAEIRRLAADEEALDNRVDVVLWQIIDTMRGDWAAEED